MSEVNNLRLVALKLHGLHPKDQTWMLDRLEEPEQLKIRVLLEELNELGFVPIENITNDVASYPVRNIAFDPNLIASIDILTSETALKNLNGLPERLRAMVLHSKKWQWSGVVWQKIEQHERARLITHMNQFAQVKPPVFVALLESFKEEISRGKAASVMKTSQSA